MNLPNKLTVLRMLLVPVFMIFIILPGLFGFNGFLCDFLAAVFFGAAAFTDFLDGNIARKRGIVTDFGKFLDPIADKFMVFGALFALMAVENSYFRYILLFVTTIVVLRELAVTALRLVAKGEANVVIAASWLGKVKTASQSVGIVLMLLEKHIFSFSDFFVEYRPISVIACIVIVYFTLVSGIDYMKTYWKFLSKER